MPTRRSDPGAGLAPSAVRWLPVGSSGDTRVFWILGPIFLAVCFQAEIP